MHQEIDEGAHLRLREPARRVNRVDALGFHRQLWDHIFDQTRLQRISVEVAGQIGDAQTRHGRV